MKIEFKPYEKNCDIELVIDGKKYKYKTTEEFVKLPLGDLIELYQYFKHPKWYVRLFDVKYMYYKDALKSIKDALNKISIETSYGYIKNSLFND